ncbi:DNA-binding domain-containing protein [Sphingomonas sp. 10B4]|uniref:HvfC/BufC N-terminal domain-containing protein n=1 Tax=Sphingomonas sp. 10B4 TaxID=3048575 RepID=UPI002AB5A39E|nr:DNA-binding domain-containing protein [Sphingomonas sp. 10B4]MDY7525197.1 DNA-binding domain-containing protein [Sphingomonas sp. 10B4]
MLTLQRDMRAWLVAADADAANRYGSAAAAGLLVYQNTYRAQLVACLEESFVQTRAWVGGEAFHHAIVAHIERVPPTSWTLDAYPRDFPATLALLYPDDPEVAELAWIEYALGEAFVGPDSRCGRAADQAHPRKPANTRNRAVTCATGNCRPPRSSNRKAGSAKPWYEDS